MISLRIKILALFLPLMTGSFFGLAQTKQPAQTQQTLQEQKPLAFEPQAKTAKADTALGEQTLRGYLHGDKGGMAVVAGLFLSDDFVFSENEHKWKPEVEALRGKFVEVKGKVWRHYCEPYEQCLDQGYMDFMREVSYLKLADVK